MTRGGHGVYLPGGSSRIVGPPSDPSLVARVAALEEQLRRLTERLLVVEQQLAVRRDHPLDQQVVERKVTYDWQA